MPYKDRDKQRDAVRRAVNKVRGITEGEKVLHQGITEGEKVLHQGITDAGEGITKVLQESVVLRKICESCGELRLKVAGLQAEILLLKRGKVSDRSIPSRDSHECWDKICSKHMMIPIGGVCHGGSGK